VNVDVADDQSTTHEASGQQTSGRVIAQQCTGMQSAHATTVFLVKIGFTIRMAVNLQDYHPLPFIHETLDTVATFLLCVFVRSETLLTLYPRPYLFMRHAQFMAVHRPYIVGMKVSASLRYCQAYTNPWFYCTLPIFTSRCLTIGSTHGKNKMNMKLIYQCFFLTTTTSTNISADIA
jgi:hypothetical protein